MAASRNSELDPSVRYLHCVVPEVNTDFGHTLTPFEQFGRLLEAHGIIYGHKVLECSSIGGLQHRPRLWAYGLHPGIILDRVVVQVVHLAVVKLHG